MDNVIKAASVGSPIAYQVEWSSSGSCISAFEAIVAASNIISNSSISAWFNSSPTSFNIDPSGLYPKPVISYSWKSNHTFLTVISFLVNVPVLSVAITFVEPNVSTDASFFTTAFFLAKRSTPCDKATVVCIGNAWGTTATAMPNP